MIINDLDDYYIVFDTKNRNIELDTLKNNKQFFFIKRGFLLSLHIILHNPTKNPILSCKSVKSMLNL